MHSTLQELRLTQRALRSSCRQCSVRCQSPRRAFHRSPPLRNSQEPGNNGGSNTTPASTEDKQGKEDKTPIASSTAAANAPYLPHAPPSIRHESSAPSSDQPAASSFYGSSWNRRQRVRAQQAPVEPPFVAPQWFYDHNVAVWGHGSADLGYDNPHLIGHVDEIEAANEPSNSSIWGGGPSEGPKDEEDSQNTTSDPSSVSKPASDIADAVHYRGHWTDGYLPPGEARYYVGRGQFVEILFTTRGLLRMSPRQQHQGEPAAQASNLILHYAGKDGEYMLDGLVRGLAVETASDLITLDVQDIADLISHAGSTSKDSMTMEGRMLSYEVLMDAQANQIDPSPPAEDDDAFEETESFGMPPIPGLGGDSGQPMIFGKPFTVAIDLGRGLGDRKGGNKGRPSMLDQLFSPRSTASPSLTPRDLVDASAVPLRSIVDGLLSALPTKRLEREEISERKTKSEADGLPTKTTIVHIKDMKNIQNVLVGSQFLSSLYNAVETRRNNGESIIIIGTEGPKDPSVHYSATKIDSIQRTPESGDTSRTIVLSPLLPSTKTRENLLEDRERRIATINLRHLWEMMRINSDKDFLGLEPGFWNKNILDRLTSVDRQMLSKEVWPFQQVHRFATYIGGMPHHEYVINETDREEGKISPVVNSVGKMISNSDTSKLIWVEKNAANADYESFASGRTVKNRRRRTPTVEDKAAAKLEQIRASAPKHEKKLMSGVIEPWKISTTFKDVHVPAETIEAVQTLTTLSLIRPEAFRYGVLASDRIPGLLLYGPPGTGKTLLAKAVAHESSATMLEVSAADLNDMYVGEGEKNVKALFSLARKLSPCIVFLDEADSMFSARGAAGRRASHRELLNQFLKEWDGMSNDAGSAFLMVATNRPMDFDDAVLRRLPRRLLVDLPTEKDREQILKIHLKNEMLAEQVDLADLAKKTPFYSGSDLKNLCVAAALNAVREENSLADKQWAEKREAAFIKMKEEMTAGLQQTWQKAQKGIEAKVDAESGGDVVGVGDEKASEGPKDDSAEPDTVQPKYKHEPLVEKVYPERRILTGEHFRKALEEITASVSEDMNSLKEIKKFDDVYGDKKGRKRKVKSWGFRRVGSEGEDIEGERRDTIKVREE